MIIVYPILTNNSPSNTLNLPLISPISITHNLPFDNTIIPNPHSHTIANKSITPIKNTILNLITHNRLTHPKIILHNFK